MSGDSKDGNTSPGNRVSYRVIAAQVGVSPQAVALAMRDAPGVSEETRKKVKAAAEKLGYRPQPAMSALMREVRLHPTKREVLKMAFLNCWNEPFLKSKAEPLVNFYIGAREKADAMGYTVEVFDVNPNEADNRKLNRSLRASGVDGVLIFPTLLPMGDLKLEWNDYALVEIGQPLFSVPLPLVTPHHSANMGVICRKLLETGHKRIGFLHETHIHERVRGAYLAGFLAAGWPDHRRCFVDPIIVEEVTKDIALRYLRKNRCDALVIDPHFDLDWLKDDYSIPETLSLAAFALFQADCNAGVSGIDERWKVVGEIATEHLARRIQAHARGVPNVSEVVMAAGEWVNGRTIRNII